MAKILIIEDDRYLADLVAELLRFEGNIVEHLYEGSGAPSYLKTYLCDLIILDVELPGMNGFEILKAYRSGGGKTAVLMLTNKADIADKEMGLEIGADDYLPKPFDMRELKARVKALLRRPRAFLGDVLKVSDLELHQGTNQVLKNGQVVELMPKELNLLQFLMRHPKQTFSLEALLERVWPADSESTEEAARSTMKRLRRKIDPDGQLIKTVHGSGFFLDA